MQTSLEVRGSKDDLCVSLFDSLYSFPFQLSSCQCSLSFSGELIRKFFFSSGELIRKFVGLNSRFVFRSLERGGREGGGGGREGGGANFLISDNTRELGYSFLYSRSSYRDGGHEQLISSGGRFKPAFAERNKCKPVLLGFSLARNLVKPLLSLYGTEWRDRGYMDTVQNKKKSANPATS
jgi:hypothetical protein